MADNSEVFDPTTPTTSSAAPAPVAADAPPTNTFALVGFILSLFSLVTFITAIPGLVLGHLALKKIRVTGEGGRGMAIAAVAIGWVIVGTGVLTALIIGFLFLIPLIIVAATGAPGSY
ncbi:MAG: DUF4190 domain-containing protein [Microbacteriaceae bacterium]|nr:DUF4190 domain-containing protein [Microbacteriaceae bacterium]